MTAAIVLKPDFAGTFSFGLLRVIGTLLGLFLVTALIHYAFGGIWERVALVGLFALGFRLLTTVHYGIGVTMLTGLVVLLFSFDGVPPGDMLAARGIATAIGSALALLAYLVWPTWEHLRVRPALAAMIDTYRAYLATLPSSDAEAGADGRSEARSAARTARTNAQASLDRLRGEPRRDRALISLAEGVFANANRFVRAGMALEAATRDAGALPEEGRVRAFLRTVCGNLQVLAGALRDGSVPVIVPLRGEERALNTALAAVASDDDARSAADAVAEALDRLTDSVDTLAHLLRRADGEAAGTPPSPLPVAV
jgi:uncharacterized membrane protein YccC